MYKYLLVFFISLNSYASDTCGDEKVEINTEVPRHLRNAEIIVRDAKGRETKVSSNKFKVVPRRQQFIVSKSKFKKNRVALLGGYGSTGGVSTQRLVGNTIEVESKTGFVGGLQYQRMLNDTLSIGIQGQTSRTGLIMVGLDF